MGRDDASRANISHDSMVDVLLPSTTCPARDAWDGNLPQRSLWWWCVLEEAMRGTCVVCEDVLGEACTAVEGK